MTNNDQEPISLTMLIMHRRQKRDTIEAFLQSDVYTCILIAMVQNGFITNGQAWIHCDQEETFTYKGITVRLISNFDNKTINPNDVAFVRGDKKVFLPTLKNSHPRRLIFYGASTRGIPRYWQKFHGILVDDECHLPVLKQFFPHCYTGIFFKTAAENIFHPLEDTQKEFDVCMVPTSLTSPHKQLDSMIEVIKALPETRFVICGRPDPQTEQRLSGKPGQVVFPGFIPQTELNKIYNQSKIAIMCSGKTDASPRVLLEFMAANLPTLVNEDLCGGTKYAIKGFGEMASTKDFINMIPQMINSIDQYQPQQVFKEHFSPKVAAKNLYHHIQHVLEMSAVAPKPSLKGHLSRFFKFRVDQEYKKLKGTA